MRHLLRLVSALLIVALPALARAEDRFFDSGGVRLRYVEQGSGDPIVLVHGYTADIERSWVTTGVLVNLAKDYRVIAFDNRGHGKSGKPHDPKAYGNEMTEDVVRLMDHLNIRRAHIVGYSMGGQIVLKLLTRHPERFVTATIGGSAGVRNWTAENDRAGDAEAADTERGLFRRLILSVAPTDEPTPTDAYIRERSQQLIGYGNDPLALSALVRARRGFAVTDEEIPAIRVATLAVVGSADSQVTKVSELKKVMPSLKVVVLPGAVHSVANDRGVQRRPEYVKAIRDFIAAHHESSSR